jgi:hypothetical protein
MGLSASLVADALQPPVPRGPLAAACAGVPVPTIAQVLP